MSLPSIAIVVPTYNESRNIRRNLESLTRQDYPADRFTIYVVDGLSTDETLQIAKQYQPVVCLNNPKRNAESAKQIGYNATDSDLFMYIDADAWFANDQWLQRMVFPLQHDERIVASISTFVPGAGDPAINRYLSYQELQLDPMLEFLSGKLEHFVIDKYDGYELCDFGRPGTLPVIGSALYRRSVLREVVSPEADKWMEVDIPRLLVRQGYRYFACVRHAGICHRSVYCFADLLRKKKRGFEGTFMSRLEATTDSYTYVDLSNPAHLGRLLIWVVYANFLPLPMARGIWKAWVHRDWAGLYELPATTIVTDYVLLLFLASSRGRRILQQKMAKLVSRLRGHSP